jgi:hypothetical protein
MKQRCEGFDGFRTTEEKWDDFALVSKCECVIGQG